MKASIKKNPRKRTHVEKRKKTVTKEKDQKIYWAYCRVSSLGQTVESQLSGILQYSNVRKINIERTFKHKVSAGKTQRKRGIDKLKESARNGEFDVLIFSELSRMARSVSEIIRLVDFFVHECNRVLFFVKENLRLAPGKKDVSSTVLLSTFALLAEIEKMLISERTKEGLQARKAKGFKLGRPKGKSKLDQHVEKIKDRLALGVTQKRIAKDFDCTPVTLCNWLKLQHKKERKRKNET